MIKKGHRSAFRGHTGNQQRWAVTILYQPFPQQSGAAQRTAASRPWDQLAAAPGRPHLCQPAYQPKALCSTREMGKGLFAPGEGGPTKDPLRSNVVLPGRLGPPEARDISGHIRC
ncbi:unnamed protein product [Boreogadus saida]